MSADDGGLKPGSRASGVGEPRSDEPAADRDGADDLDALASKLGSLVPGADADDAADDDSNVAKLAALSARSTKESPEPIAAAPAAQAAAPVAAAAPAPARASWVVPLIVGLGLGVGIAGVVFGMSARREAEPAAAGTAAQPPQAPALAQAPSVAAPAAEAAPSPSVPPGVAPPVGVTPAPSASPSPAPVAHGSVATAAQGSVAAAPRARPAPEEEPASASAGPTPDSRAQPVLAVRPAAPEAPAAEASDEGEDEPARPAPTNMDTLLDEALSPEARRQEIEEKKRLQLEESKIPLTPSREDVTQALTVLLPAIRGCAMGHIGQAIAAIVVHADGRVASAEIAGAPFAGTASGRCMEGVIRRARFPRFSQPSFRVRFPLAIQ